MVANYQLDIVRNGGLIPLAKLITSNKLPLILSAVACIRNISIHPLNETPIIDSGFLPHLVRLLDRTEDEVLCHTVITMRNVPSSRVLCCRLVGRFIRPKYTSFNIRSGSPE